MNVTAHQSVSRIVTMSKYDGKIAHLLLERCFLQLRHQLENPWLQNNATSLGTRGGSGIYGLRGQNLWFPTRSSISGVAVSISCSSSNKLQQLLSMISHLVYKQQQWRVGQVVQARGCIRVGRVDGRFDGGVDDLATSLIITVSNQRPHPWSSANKGSKH